MFNPPASPFAPIDPSAYDLAMVVVLFGMVLVLSAKERLNIERTFFHAGLRCVAQLLLVGYIIEFVFMLSRWYMVAAVLVAMSVIASRTASGRTGAQTAGLDTGLIVWFAIFSGTFIDTFIVTGLILKIEPWWNPHFLIPLAGMIMGNALNSGSLAGDRFIAELKNRKNEIETMLILGFPAKEACMEMKRSAVKGALIPTFNAMFTVGLVHLPGMMTGQILGGASPVTASKYQIIVMFMISGTVLITALILVNLLRGKVFTKDHQIRYHLIGK